jgi:hypothetical protein
LEREHDASATGGNAYCMVGLALRYRLERAREPNGSRANMIFRKRKEGLLLSAFAEKFR